MTCSTLSTSQYGFKYDLISTFAVTAGQGTTPCPGPGQVADCMTAVSIPATQKGRAGVMNAHRLGHVTKRMQGRGAGVPRCCARAARGIMRSLCITCPLQLARRPSSFLLQACYRKKAFDGSPVTCYCPIYDVPSGVTYYLGSKIGSPISCTQPAGYVVSGA